MLYGQRVSATGSLVGSAFPIFIGSQPAVAYNAQDDQYLIVWSLNGLGSYTPIVGRLLSWDGSLLGPEFLVWSSPNRKLTHPRAAWNSQRNEYFILWQAQDSTTATLTDVAGVHVSPAGICDTTATLITTAYRPGEPDIAYNPGPPSQYGLPGNQYYIVWSADSYFGEYDARDSIGARLDWEGKMIYPVVPLSDRRSYVGVQEPAVATNQSNLYFTAWRHLDYLSNTAQIQAKVVNLYGNPTSGVLPISPEMNVLSSGRPAIAAAAAPWDSKTNEFLVVWTMATIAGRSILGSRCIVDDRNLVSCEPFAVRAETGGGASFIAIPTAASGGGGYLLTYGAYPIPPVPGPQNAYGRLLILGPAAKTNSASEITDSGAKLNGTVNAKGFPSDYYFQWGLTAAYGSTTPTRSAGGGIDDLNVSEPLSGLTLNTDYHYRIVASNSAELTYGDNQTFRTLATPVYNNFIYLPLILKK
jgi:hypothetical protein